MGSVILLDGVGWADGDKEKIDKEKHFDFGRDGK
jgi:hypothetical protein